MDSKKPNKITEIVRLQQMLKKWKKLGVAPKSNSRRIKFLKRTLSFSDTSSALSGNVPKGYLAVCVGEEMQRFVIPTEYLSHRAFAVLLREAEEEFGFQQEGVLRIPCEVSVFESTLKVVEKKKEGFCYCSSDAEVAQAHQSITHQNQCGDEQIDCWRHYKKASLLPCNYLRCNNLHR